MQPEKPMEHDFCRRVERCIADNFEFDNLELPVRNLPDEIDGTALVSPRAGNVRDQWDLVGPVASG